MKRLTRWMVARFMPDHLLLGGLNMSSKMDHLKWWNGKQEEIYDKALSTCWGALYVYTQQAFAAGFVAGSKAASQQAVPADGLTEVA